jgi:hypothetical protein
MSAHTASVLVWIALMVCYAWSVWNLARMSRKPDLKRKEDATRIVTTRRSERDRTSAVPPTAASQKRVSGSPS